MQDFYFLFVLIRCSKLTWFTDSESVWVLVWFGCCSKMRAGFHCQNQMILLRPGVQNWKWSRTVWFLRWINEDRFGSLMFLGFIRSLQNQHFQNQETETETGKVDRTKQIENVLDLKLRTCFNFQTDIRTSSDRRFKPFPPSNGMIRIVFCPGSESVCISSGLTFKRRTFSDPSPVFICRWFLQRCEHYPGQNRSSFLGHLWSRPDPDHIGPPLINPIWSFWSSEPRLMYWINENWNISCNWSK